ncbi:MAG: serine hydrolase [Dehalococcoidia bacterium]|nr:MAG: serine hydrolase [Dehalococcoidia bacterium]
MKGTLKSRINSILLVVLCVSILIFISCHNTTEREIISISSPTITTSYPEVDDYIVRQMKADEIPGLAIVVVQGEEVVYCKGFGNASVKGNLPVTPQTIFDLASVSKSFTALGVLLLRDNGLIDLDASVQQYLPDFRPDDPLASHITVHHLLNHTSGLPGAFSAPLIFQQGDDELVELVAALSKVRLNREPGLLFEYADINYCLLGALIEAVSEITFEEYIHQMVLKPLDMENTTLYPEEADAKGKADGHQAMYNQIVTRNIPVYRSALPAGWVMSCAKDMGQWLIVNLNDGRTARGQVIPMTDIEEAHAPTVTFEENGEEISYGMGWFISSADDEFLIWHGGDTPNFMADMILLPDYKTGVVVLINSQACTIGHDIAPEVANLILGLELETIGVPWWAHWKTIDTLATFTLVFILILILALLFYSWYIWRQFRAGKRCYIGSSFADSILLWRLALYITPLVLAFMFVMTGYLVIRTLYGYNLFEVLFLFGLGAPPGVYISGVSLLIVILLWAFTLAFVGIFTRGIKKA